MLDPNAAFYRVVPPDREITDPYQISPATFIPRPIDRDQLSIYDSALISPRECLDLYNRRPDRPQARAVTVITAQEVQNLGLEIKSQPTSQSEAHYIIDFSVIKPQLRNQTSFSLLETAQQRGVILDP